ncbi:hypothetical protein V5F44_12030 [Xanthobacter sp. V2C-8]|uniref:hypothetical protein n=1 Tax=Xanthobacter albus TaxID=3119929 RepID=UPI00372942B2
MASPPPRRQTPATAGLARRLYAEGVPIADICARTGLSTGAAYHWIDREVAADGSIALRPIGRRAGKTFALQPAETPRARLLARLWRAAERQVAEIEARIPRPEGADAAPPRAAADAEKDARALALLARTLRELAAAEGEADKSGKDADDPARDLDAFRRELARRLEGLRADEPDAGAPLPPEPLGD